MSPKLLDCIKYDEDKGLLRMFEAREGFPYDFQPGLSSGYFSQSMFLV